MLAVLVAWQRPPPSRRTNPDDDDDDLTNQSAAALTRSTSRLAGDHRRARLAIAAEVITEHARYATPRHASGDRATIVDDMRAFQAKFPGGHFDIGDVSAHHDVALLTWVLVQADGTEVARGHDQLRVGADGRIAELITFARRGAPRA